MFIFNWQVLKKIESFLKYDLLKINVCNQNACVSSKRDTIKIV